MNENLLKSIIFHLVIAILLVVSTWSIFSRRVTPIDETPIVVTLAPMGEKTNLKPAPKREVKPPQPKKPEPKKPEPKPEPKKPEPKKPEPKKPEPKKPEKKPEPKKDELDKMLDKLDKEQPDKLDNLLKDLDKTKPDETKSSNETDTKDDSKSDKPFDKTSPESLAEEDYIKKLISDQLKQCWSPPAGVRDAKDLIVRVNVDIALDGTMKFIGFEGPQTSNPIYQAAADSARRAVLDLECNPLRQLPPVNKYSIWKEMTLIFDPKDLIY